VLPCSGVLEGGALFICLNGGTHGGLYSRSAGELWQLH